ncbi:fucose mutarotase isoform X2 [Cynoglossus semilaevis]|uniref:fucose mutarotase isoform X2 n=1 Tax=Cynoglossus semilaevis TaxID=244447 RepID=UPI000D62FB40|nr:fucose mutarotase isoform X2 [Cynoglossus semilaevis]
MVVLKGIPAILSPELLYALAKMGHGDELGLGIPQLLEAILKLFPLDTYVTSPAAVMDRVDADKLRNLPVPVWDVYSNLLSKSGSNADLELVERFEFYDRAKAAFAVVATGYVFDLFLLLLQKQCKMFKLLRKRFIVYWMSVNCSPAGALPFICNFYFSFSSVGLLYEKAYFRTERTNRFLLLYYCSHLSVNIDIGSEVTCQ